MPIRFWSSRQWRSFLIIVMIIVAATAGGWMLRGRSTSSSEPTVVKTEPSEVELVSCIPPTLRVPPAVASSLHMTTARVEPYAIRCDLKLDGTVFVDPSQIARVHSRFAGEVMEIGPASTYASISRPLQFGDHVTKGQLLAVVWCKDLGEKKSELVDALLQLRLDTVTL